MKCIWLNLSLLLLSGIACGEPTQATEPPKIVTIRGQESLIQDINMGPKGTEFWKRLQMLIENPELTNFPRLVDILKLKISQSLDLVDNKSAIPVWRTDIKSKDSFILGGSYGVGFSTNEAPQRFISLSVDFDLRQVCISKLEILRAYREIRETGPIDVEYAGVRDHSGISHSIGVISKQVGFRIAPSGCAESMKITRYQNN